MITIDRFNENVVDENNNDDCYNRINIGEIEYYPFCKVGKNWQSLIHYRNVLFIDNMCLIDFADYYFSISTKHIKLYDVNFDNELSCKSEFTITDKHIWIFNINANAKVIVQCKDLNNKLLWQIVRATSNISLEVVLNESIWKFSLHPCKNKNLNKLLVHNPDMTMSIYQHINSFTIDFAISCRDFVFESFYNQIRLYSGNPYFKPYSKISDKCFKNSFKIICDSLDVNINKLSDDDICSKINNNDNMLYNIFKNYVIPLIRSEINVIEI